MSSKAAMSEKLCSSDWKPGQTDDAYRDGVTRLFKAAWLGLVEMDESGRPQQDVPPAIDTTQLTRLAQILLRLNPDAPNPVTPANDSRRPQGRKGEDVEGSDNTRIPEMPQQDHTGRTSPFVPEQNPKRYPPWIITQRDRDLYDLFTRRLPAPHPQSGPGTFLLANTTPEPDTPGKREEREEASTDTQPDDTPEFGIGHNSAAEEGEEEVEYSTSMPSRDSLEKVAPEREWSNEIIQTQERIIETTTEAANHLNFAEFLDRVPEARKVGAFFAFDGSQLMYVKDGVVLRAWPAISGQEGFNAGEHQTLQNLGPIPEGSWLLEQSEYQSFQDVSSWDRLKGTFGRGTWPGGVDSWGENRIWVSGEKGEKLPEKHGRSGFSIHGGEIPGSRGCIDMTEFMPNFILFFRDLNIDMPLFVSYGRVDTRQD